MLIYYIAFIEYSKAVDSVQHKNICEALVKQAV